MPGKIKVILSCKWRTISTRIEFFMIKPRQFSDRAKKFTSQNPRRFVKGKLSRGEDNQDEVVAVEPPNVLEIGARVLGQTMEQLTEENPYVHQVGHFQIASSIDAVEACGAVGAGGRIVIPFDDSSRGLNRFLTGSFELL